MKARIITTVLLTAFGVGFFGACTTSTAPTSIKAESRTTHPAAAAPSIPANEVAALAEKITSPLKSARYMHGKDLGSVRVPGWEGFPTRKWSYEERDKDGTRRPAELVMLNPDAEKLAAWIISASYEIKGRNDAKFCDKLFNHIIACSGGQFVVRGICLEDMKKTGTYKAYPFQDGVTVRLKQIPDFPKRPLTPGEQSAALNSTQRDVTYFHKKARLQSSEPEHWAAATKTPEASNGAWLDIVRKEYQRAWNSDTNAMLTATAKTLGL